MQDPMGDPNPCERRGLGLAQRRNGGGFVARQLEVKAERVAVELNLEILDRGAFAQRPLHDGDRVEILGFIGGGSF